MTSGAPPEPTSSGYAPNESRRAAALPSRVDDSFVRQCVSSLPPLGEARNNITDTVQTATARPRPVGCFASAASAQVCRDLPSRISSPALTTSSEKLPAAARFDDGRASDDGISALLHRTDAALGSRGMVQSASPPLPRASPTVRLGAITARTALPTSLADSHASRKRSKPSIGLYSLRECLARTAPSPQLLRRSSRDARILRRRRKL